MMALIGRVLVDKGSSQVLVNAVFGCEDPAPGLVVLPVFLFLFVFVEVDLTTCLSIAAYRNRLCRRPRGKTVLF